MINDNNKNINYNIFENRTDTIHNSYNINVCEGVSYIVAERANDGGVGARIGPYATSRHFLENAIGLSFISRFGSQCTQKRIVHVYVQRKLLFL